MRVDASLEDARKWLVTNRTTLAAELTTLKIKWTPEARAKCAWTEYRAGAPVELSFPACRGVISSKQEAGKLLIHEAAHHLGVEDHEFATRLGIVAYMAWENMLLNEVSFCDEASIKNNILASRLPGSWKYDAELDRILGNYEGDYDPTKTEFHFSVDPTATQLFPGIGRCVFLAGWMHVQFVKKGQLRTLRSPYVVSEWKGNPTVFHDEDHDLDGTDVVTDLHANFMLIARGEKPENDLLFQGGDNNNQRLYALRRMPVTNAR
jgi:hypothetical protein